MKPSSHEAVVIGGSAGALDILMTLFAGLPEDYNLPIITVIHLHPSDDGNLASFFNEKSNLRIKQAEEKEAIRPGVIYMAPSNYHLQVKQNRTLSLSKDMKINYARPSIDVLFESAALVYLKSLTGIILSGSNHDGSKGISKIKLYGGCTVSQAPLSAEYPIMPQAAIDTGDVDFILSVPEILRVLLQREE